MSDNTKIQWTDATWNPTTGCSKVSDGCKNCYAERVTARFRKDHLPWTLQNAAHNVVLHPERLDIPLRWKKPRRIFVDSMSDLFHEQVPFSFIEKVFWRMVGSDRHTFQILTKRPEGMLKFMRWFQKENERRRDAMMTYVKLPLRNVWLGVSVEDQKAADERIPLLLQTPAAVRFLSCEPLLGAVDLSEYFGYCDDCDDYMGQHRENGRIQHDDSPIHWVIVGGESGSGSRLMDSDWARSLRYQCVNAEVPFFFKQWGEHDDEGKRVGKHKAGRLLDGREWNEMPEGK